MIAQVPNGRNGAGFNTKATKGTPRTQRFVQVWALPRRIWETGAPPRVARLRPGSRRIEASFMRRPSPPGGFASAHQIGKPPPADGKPLEIFFPCPLQVSPIRPPLSQLSHAAKQLSQSAGGGRGRATGPTTHEARFNVAFGPVADARSAPPAVSLIRRGSAPPSGAVRTVRSEQIRLYQVINKLLLITVVIHRIIVNNVLLRIYAEVVDILLTAVDNLVNNSCAIWRMCYNAICCSKPSQRGPHEPYR